MGSMESRKVGNKMSSSEVNDIIIVGAGMTGLTLGWDLTQKFPNLKLRILEKSKSSGGRMATRRINDLKFDHGAQFIKKCETSQRWIETWQQEDVAQKFPTDLFDAFCGCRGITQLAKTIAKPLSIDYDHKVISLTAHHDVWILKCENGQFTHAKKVILTCPLPQSLELLTNSQVSFNSELSKIIYSKALVLLIESDQDTLSPMRYQENIGHGLFSICAQHLKNPMQSPSWTAVMTTEWSAEHFDQTEDEILKKALVKLSKVFPKLKVQKIYLKKWRFAQPQTTWPSPFDNPAPGLYLGGDAFGGPSLTGALRSSQGLLNWLGYSSE